MAAPAAVSKAEEEKMRARAIKEEMDSLTTALENTDVAADSIAIDPLVELGSGTFGVVNRGTLRLKDTDTQVQVAVKSLFTNVKPLQFLREVRALRLLLNVPNVVQLLGWCQSPRCIALELMDCSLSAFIRRNNHKMSWKQRTTLAGQLCSAIATAHGRGVFHRDIKPSNLLVTADGLTLKVGDFGQAYVKARVDDDTTMHDSAEGSRLYWGPELHNYKKPTPRPQRTPAEQAAIKDFHRRTDVWAIGCTLHFIITGAYPFSDLSNAELAKDMKGEETQKKLIERLSNERPDGCPESLFSIMRRCFSLDPTLRPTAGELVQDINNVLQGMADEPATAPVVATAAAAASAPAFAVVPAHGDDNLSTVATGGDGHSSSQNSRFEGHTDSSTAPTLVLATPSVTGSGNAAHSSYGHRSNPGDSALSDEAPTPLSAAGEVFGAAAGMARTAVNGLGWLWTRLSSATSNGDQSQPAAASSSSSAAAAAAASSAAAAGPASTSVAFSSRQSRGSPRHASFDASSSSTHSSPTLLSMPPAVPYTPLPMCAPSARRPPAFNPYAELRTPSPALGKRTRNAMNTVSPPARASSAAASSTTMEVDDTWQSVGAASSSAAAAAAIMGARAPLPETNTVHLPSEARRQRARTVSSSGAQWEAEGVSPRVPLSPEDVAFSQGIQAAMALRLPHVRAASESQAALGAAAAAAASASNNARRASGRRDPVAAMRRWQ